MTIPDWRQMCAIDKDYLDWMTLTGDYSRLSGYLDSILASMTATLKRYHS